MPYSQRMRLYLSDSRWYTITLDSDLFGQPVVVCRFGGIGNNLNGCHEIPVLDNDLSAVVRAIRKRRLAHGYRPAGKIKQERGRKISDDG